MIRNLLGGDTSSSKCRTIDVCDIFGDGSGVALYRLDGNANDESGNYHGTETAITYGGGVYERGAVFNGSSSVINTLYPINSEFSISMFVKFNNDGVQYGLANSTNDTALPSPQDGGLVFRRDANNTIFVGRWIDNSYAWSTNTAETFLSAEGFIHICISLSSTTLNIYKNGTLIKSISASIITNSTNTLQLGSYDRLPRAVLNGSIDQFRIFNRAITATEVGILYNECAPTSTVTDANPFLDNSCKALYRFEGNANDEGTNGNLLSGSSTYSSVQYGRGLTLNGVQTASITSASYGDLVPWYNAISVPISFSMWFKPTTINKRNMIFYNEKWGGTIEMSPDNRIAFGWATNLLYTTGTYLVNSVNHVVISIVNGVSTCYVNGVLIGTISITSYNGGICCLGHGSVGLTGSIDQVRIFNKALTPMEVASLYNETTPMEEPMRALVDPFKDGSGKALYRLDGNALDESGNFNGTATNVTYGNGMFGRCGVFNGTSSKIYGAPIIQRTSNPSFSFWIKPNNTNTVKMLYNTRSQTVTNGFSIWIDGLNRIVVTHYTVNDYRGSAISTPINVFTHICVVFKTGSVDVYVNGSFNQTISTGGYVNSSVAFATIGVDPYGATAGWLNGSIDQVRIFNRALTQDEVTKLYQNENSPL